MCAQPIIFIKQQMESEAAVFQMHLLTATPSTLPAMLRLSFNQAILRKFGLVY